MQQKASGSQKEMRRFTDTSKWDDVWFRQLPCVHKLVFLYVIDRCDNAGFWEVDEEAIAWHTRLKPEHVQGALKGLERGIKGASGWVWVRRFLKHQKNDDLNPDNPAHKQIIGFIREQQERFKDIPEFQEFLAPYKGLLSPIGIGNGIGLVKEKRQRTIFVKPDIEECFVYGETQGMSRVDVQSWYDHFESNGWKVGGKAAMVDWKAALRNGKKFAKKMAPAKSSSCL